MKVRSFLIVVSTLLGAFVLGVGAFVTVSAQKEGAAIANHSTATRLARGLYHATSLAQEYATHPNVRVKEQWYVVQRDLSALLSKPAQPLTRTHIASLRSGVNELKVIFDELVTLSESPSVNPMLEEQTVGDLLVRSGTMVRTADDLAFIADAERSRLQTTTDRAVIGLIITLALLLIAALSLVFGRVVSSIGRLLKGVRRIGDGDLTVRIDADGDDEIAELARGVNGMAEKLQAARDSLERRVEERTVELRESNRWTELLLESIGDGVFAVDTEWNITLWNTAAEEISGWPRAEVIGKPFQDVVRFVRESDRSENILFISDAMLSRKVRAMEDHTLMIRKDGSEVPVSDSASPIIGPDGDVKGAIVVFRDSSSEHEARLVESSFAYASHQLRTPVTRALWAVEEALGAKRAADAREMVRTAYASLLNVRKLVTDIAEVSELDQGMIVPRLAEVSVKALIDAAIDDVVNNMKEYEVRIDCGPVPTEYRVKTDKEMFVRALVKVLENAVAYGAGKRVSVSVNRDGKVVLFEVADQGIGIVPEEQHLVFTKFFRGQNLPNESIGAGLGLFLSKGYLSALKGKIWFRSKAGEGTSFFLSIPVE